MDNTQTGIYGIVGLGVTGFSVARFLASQGLPFIALDTRKAPPALAEFQSTFPTVEVITGDDWPEAIFDNMHTCVVSPGVSIEHPALIKAKNKGVEIIGDIALFLRYNQKPIIAVTGSNGKSTVVSLVAEMGKAAGKKVALVGNIGNPVLDLLLDSTFNPDIIVMELSSFQLETTPRLGALAATILNVTPDHLDRYARFEDYVLAKQQIYNGAQHVIINAQDPYSASPHIPHNATKGYFTLDVPEENTTFGLRIHNGKPWLAQGHQVLLPTDALRIQGQHNVGNALSALALGSAAQLPMTAMLNTLQTFVGLPHRCQWVAHHNNILWINDSKGTNVGACEAALHGLGTSLSGKIILLLGGDGKGADFTPLIPLVQRYCRAVIIMGKDAPLLIQTLATYTTLLPADNMAQAVTHAKAIAAPGDIVLLSPACASLDQYRDYTHRGNLFMDEVKKVLCVS